MNASNSASLYQSSVRDRKTASYLLWAGFFFGAAGLHRFYNGKIISGLIWFFTLGFFGIGQFVDLLLIPDMAEGKARRLHGDQPSPYIPPTSNEPALVENPDSLMVRLLKIAHANGGRLTVTRSVMETGVSFEEIERELKAMVKAGYADVTNDPGSGVVVYEFRELVG